MSPQQRPPEAVPPAQAIDVHLAGDVRDGQRLAVGRPVPVQHLDGVHPGAAAGAGVLGGEAAARQAGTWVSAQLDAARPGVGMCVWCHALYCMLSVNALNGQDQRPPGELGAGDDVPQEDAAVVAGAHQDAGLPGV